MDIENKSTTPKIPLRLSSKAIQEFQSLYFKEYQIKLSAEEANRLGMNLLKLFSSIYKPIKKNEYASK